MGVLIRRPEGAFSGFECEDGVLDWPASGAKSSKGRNQLDCIRGVEVCGVTGDTKVGGARTSQPV